MLCQYNNNNNEMDGSAYKLMLIQFSTAATNELMGICNHYYYSVCTESNL